MLLQNPKEEKELASGTVDSKSSILDVLAKRVSAPSKTQIQAAEKTFALVTQLSERNPLFVQSSHLLLVK